MLRRKENTKTATVSITPDELRQFRKIAKRRKMSFSGLLLDGANLLAGFPDAFVDQINGMAKTFKVDTSVIIVQLLLFYVAQDAALTEVYKRSNTYRCAFEYGANGLISGDELSDKVFDATKAKALELKDRIKGAGKVDGTFYSLEDQAQIANRMII